jgi:hypothetical protein
MFLCIYIRIYIYVDLSLHFDEHIPHFFGHHGNLWNLSVPPFHHFPRRLRSGQDNDGRLHRRSGSSKGVGL